MSVKYLKNLGVTISLSFLLCLGGLWVLSPTVAAPVSGLEQNAPMASTKYNPVITITSPMVGEILTSTSQTIVITYRESETITIDEDELGISFSGREGPYYTTTQVLTETSVGDMWTRVYTYEWMLSEEDYVSHTLVARARNSQGQEAHSEPLVVYVDRIAPRPWISVPVVVTQTPEFLVTWGADDGSPDLRYDVHYRIDQQGPWEAWFTSTPLTQATFVVTPQTMMSQKHLYTFRLRAWDMGLNVSSWISDEVEVGISRIFLPLVVKNYPPQIRDARVTINEGSKYAYNRQVELALDATAVGDTIQEVRVKNDGSAAWETFDWPQAGTLPWTLDSSTRLQTVQVEFIGEHVSKTVASGIYLVENGDFKNDDKLWDTKEVRLPVDFVEHIVGHPGDNTSPETGKMLLLGYPHYPCSATGVPIGHAEASRTFIVPPAEYNPTLVFKYIIWTQDRSTSIQYDRFEVYVNEESTPTFADGNQNAGLGCNKWWRVPSPQNPRNDVTSGWATKTIDLSKYAGQEITVSFENHSRYDGWYNTYTYIDDVHITGGW